MERATGKESKKSSYLLFPNLWLIVKVILMGKTTKNHQKAHQKLALQG
jgi:hypothetical protein